MKVVLTILFVAGVAALWSPVGAVALSQSFFIENRGQMDASVKFYAVCPGYSVYLTRAGIVLDVRSEEVAPSRMSLRDEESLTEDEESGLSAHRRTGCAVYVRFEGALRETDPEARGECGPKFSYFLGNDRSRWLSGVRTYDEVVYCDAWPGVDLVLRLDDGCLRYSIIARPGADLSRAIFAYEGASSVGEMPDGTVRVETSVGEIQARIDGRNPSSGAWRIAEHDFERGSNPGAQIEIAPDLSDEPSCLSMSTYLGGGTTWEEGYAVALDDAENVVLAGYSYSPDFPTTPGAYDTTIGGECDGFVAKVAASGTDLIWCTFLGASGADHCLSVAVDHAGDIVVSGATFSPDFPWTPGAFDTAWALNWDGFVAKLSSGGDSLVWSSYLGGLASDWVYGLVLDQSGNAVVSGRTFSADFPVTPGAYDSTYNGKRDVFVARLSSSGSTLLSSTFLGSTGSEWGYSVALDGGGNAVVAGVTDSQTFPTTAGAYDETFNGGTTDAFIAKVSPDAHSLLWSTLFGGSLGQEEGQMVSVDAWGDVILTGFTTSADFPATTGAFDTTYSGVYDAYVAKISSDGARLVWSSFLGGSAFERGYGLAIEESGDVVVTGSSSSTDFPTTPDAYSTTLSGGALDDIFITVFASSGDNLVWSSYLGGTDMDRGYAVVLDAVGNPILTGPTYSTDFPVTPGAYDSTFNGGESDVFVSRLDLSPDAGVRPGNPGRSVAAIGESSPNPFNVSTALRFDLLEAGDISVKIFDAQGRFVRLVMKGDAAAGTNSVVWDGRGQGGHPVAPGLYFWLIEYQGNRSVKKAVLLR